jgi:hypothetical protein
MPDRSRVMTQTKRDTLVLQVGGFGVGVTTAHINNLLLRKSSKGTSWIDLMIMDGKELRRYTETTVASWRIQSM